MAGFDSIKNVLGWLFFDIDIIDFNDSVSSTETCSIGRWSDCDVLNFRIEILRRVQIVAETNLVTETQIVAKTKFLPIPRLVGKTSFLAKPM